MAEKIGQILIRKGKISPAQLREALRTQQFFGGYLGSHLINLGFIDEAVLGETLSEIYRVPYAPYDSIRLVRAEVLARIPAALAQRFRVVPIQIEGNRLHLAMLNPRDALAINEISAATGLNIAPWIAPEFRIIQALERHYRLRREGRGPISMKGKLEPDRHVASPSGRDARAGGTSVGLDGLPLDAAVLPEAVGKTAAPATGPVPRNLDEWRTAANDLMDDVPELPAAKSRGKDPSAAPKGPASPGSGGGVRGPSHGQPSRRATQQPSLQAEVRSGGEGRPSWGLEQLSEAIAAAASRDDLAQEVVAYMGKKFRRAAAFAVRQDQAAGWVGVGSGFDPERLRKISIPLDKPSIFSPLQTGQTVFIGPVPPTPENRDLYTFLGGRIPPAVLMVAVTLRERLVTVLYADNGTEPLGPIDLALWKRLAGMMAMSLEIMILKNKMKRI